MFESTLERFFQRDVLIANKLTYTQALNEVADIMFEGIVMNNIRPKHEQNKELEE
jgi:hypothetical protein